jgi:RNA polymerase sigma-70 factor, ECF subfamily
MSASINELGVDQAELTQLLLAWRDGEQTARAELIGLVYERVHRIAASVLRHAPGASLSATELSNESLLRLMSAVPDFVNRQHFFNLIAQASRQILVDAARKRLSEKRGGNVAQMPFSDLPEDALIHDQNLLKIDTAIAELQKLSPRQAEVVQMAYFGGFTQQEIADSLQMSLGTIERDLRFAKAWLKDAVDV